MYFLCLTLTLLSVPLMLFYCIQNIYYHKKGYDQGLPIAKMFLNIIIFSIGIRTSEDSNPLYFFAVILLFLVFLALVILPRYLRKRRMQTIIRQMPVSTYVDNLDNLDGTDFERLCASILEKNGFTGIRFTPVTGDQGVDIVATAPNGHTYAIQCKRKDGSVSNTAVQEVFTGNTLYHCDRTAVMTNNYFTPGAKQAAASTKTELWDRDDLFAMLAAFDDD